MAENYYDPVRWYQHTVPAGGASPPTPPFRPPGQEGPTPPVGPPPNTTALSPEEEKAYAAWRVTLPRDLQYEGDYDLRGFFKANPGFAAAPGQHMTDEFKKPNHKTFSDESKYYAPSTARLGGHWDGDVFTPNDDRYKAMVDERPTVAQGSRKRKRRAIP